MVKRLRVRSYGVTRTDKDELLSTFPNVRRHHGSGREKVAEAAVLGRSSFLLFSLFKLLGQTKSPCYC